jgi:hypothetical protein
VSSSGGSACRNFYHFWHFRPQGLEIGRFSFRVINGLSAISAGEGSLWSISSCCWIVAEKLAAAFTSTSNVALANAEVVRTRKTIARNIRPPYQSKSVDAEDRSDLERIARFGPKRAFFVLEAAGLAQMENTYNAGCSELRLSTLSVS